MKECKACKAEFENANYCGFCGQSLNETGQDVHERVQKKKKKIKLNKGHKITLGFVGFLIFTVLLVATYLKTSQIPLEVHDYYDEEAFFSKMRQEVGLEFQVDLPKEAFSYYMEKYFEDKVFPFDLKIKDVIYDQGHIVLQLDSKQVHTSLILKPVFTFKDNNLIIDIVDMRLGAWRIPISKALILDEESSFHIGLPIYLEALDVELAKESVQIGGRLDETYFKDLIGQGFLDYNMGYDRPIAGDIFDQAEVLFDHSQALLDGDFQMETFFQQFLYDREFPETFLMLMKEDTAYQLVDKFLEDSIYLDQEKYDEYLRFADDMRAYLNDQREYFIEDAIHEDLFTFVDLLGSAMVVFHQDHDYPYSMVDYLGRIYSIPAGEFVTVDLLRDYIPPELIEKLNPSIYSDGYAMYVMTETPIGYYMYYYNVHGPYETKEEALSFFNLTYGQEVKVGKLLGTGHADRLLMEEQANIYHASDAVNVRYLKSDGAYAFMIASPSHSPYQVNEFVFMKDEDEWVLVSVYDTKKAYEENLYFDYKDAISGFNVTLLPTYDPVHYKIWTYTNYGQNELIRRLRSGGDIGDKEEVNYISRADDFMVMALESGRKLALVFEKGSELNYTKVYKGETYQDLLAHLKELYPGTSPDFVFLQN